MKVLQTFTTLIRLVRLGEGNYLKLMNASSLARLHEAFQFGPQAEVKEREGQVPVIRFRHGEYDHESGETMPIIRLQIEPRKLLLEVTGSSADGEKVYQLLIDELVDLTGVSRKVFADPLLETDESVIIAQMDFHADALYATQLANTIRTFVAERGAFGVAEAFALPAVVAFEVDYLPTDTTLSERHIGLTKKELTIQANNGYDLSEQVFLSKAPFPTELHLELLEMIETILNRN